PDCDRAARAGGETVIAIHDIVDLSLAQRGERPRPWIRATVDVPHLGLREHADRTVAAWPDHRHRPAVPGAPRLSVHGLVDLELRGGVLRRARCTADRRGRSRGEPEAPPFDQALLQGRIAVH